MTPESLEDHLRKATRHFTARLPEEQVFTLGRDLARELARLHAESPPRHPEIDPATIGFVDGKLWLFQCRPFLGNDDLKNVPALAVLDAPASAARTATLKLEEALR